jgi:DNA-binding transcriptional regulator YiaG
MWSLDRSRRVVPIPRWQAAALLDIADDDRDGLQRITNALSAMRGIEFHSINYDTEGKPRGRAEGSVVAAFMWGARPSIDQRGRGNPGVDPDTIIGVELTELGMGMVRAFYTGNTKADSGRRPYLKTNTLSPFTSKAARWSRPQQRLAEFIRHNITINADPAAQGREGVVMTNDRTPRRYGRDFCPLLPEGDWVGSMGHFATNPEAGWRLDSKGGKGLLSMMGRPVPRTAGPGRWGEVVREAFADIAAVIEVMGGVVFGCAGGEWLRVETVAGLPGRRPLEVPLFVFLPPDYARREAEVVEAHHRGRVERGETSTLVTVTEDVEAYQSQLREADKAQALREEVRALRRGRKVSQDALATTIGITQRQLSRWEAGNTELPVEVIERLREWCRSGV